MIGLALLMTAELLAIAGLHAYWGLGGIWPGTDETSLVRTVAGFKGRTRMPPPRACFAVAAALTIAAAWPLMLASVADPGLPRSLLLTGGASLTALFLARGLAGYLPAWRRLTPEQPFARLDRVLYSPLCLALGVGFLATTLAKATS